MPFLKKFCFCIPLRYICLLLAYFMLVPPLVNFVWLILLRKFICTRLITLWIFADFFNVLASFLLISAIYLESSNILPLHIVSKLIGLIVELICHLLIASVEISQPLSMISSGLSIGCTCLDVLVALRFYQQVEPED
ncbi:uncharacterized protein LOC111079113 [Drosophila obscura]|uniref:uncharacterized protein LOC111079113 n=1 Tax=Drosophila obscura TaxID=7282 RepID=UPI000BA15E27|nr:uncharacterized protein LOC111079113 [Drosophila obscura]